MNGEPGAPGKMGTSLKSAFATFFERTPFPVLGAAREHIVYANSAACAAFGSDQQNLIGRDVRDFISCAFDGNSAEPERGTVRKPNGEKFHAEVRCWRVTLGADEALAIGITRVDTRAEELVVDVSSALTQPGNMRETLRACAKAVAHALDAAVEIWRVDERKRTLELQASAGMSQPPIAPAPYAQRIAATGAAEFIEGGEAEHQSIAAFPLLSDGVAIGVLAVTASHPIDASVKPILASVAALVSQGMERHDVHERLVENRRQLQLALQAGGMGAWRWTAADDRAYWSPAQEALFGLTPGSYDGTYATFIQMVHPEDREGLGAAFTEAWRSGKDYRLDYRVVWPGRTIRWLAAQGRVFSSAAGIPEGMTGVSWDITDRKNAEREIQESKTRLGLAMRAGRMGAWSYEWETGKLDLSPELQEILGLGAGDFTGDVEELQKVVESEYREALLSRFAGSHEANELQFDFRFHSPRGRPGWMEARGQLFREMDGSPARLAGIAIDITERKHAEHALGESEEKFRALFGSSRDGIAVSVNERYVYVNGAFAEMFGHHDPAELLGMQVYSHLPEPERTMVREIRQRRAAGEPGPDIYRARGLRADGSTFDTEVRASEFLVRSVTHTLAIVRDITERKLAEEELTKQAYELARSNADLQQFAYITSHDLQEPLRTITSYAQLLTKRYSGQLDQDADDFLNFIAEGAQRMSLLIRDLLAYSRIVNSEGLKLCPVDLEAAVHWAEMNLQLTIEDCQADIRYRELPNAMGDQVQLVQLFQNLISNAIKYRGREKPQICINARESGQLVEVCVSDNGIGIAAEHHERIFGVFKRLHGQRYPGTGIGLAICKKIVEKHNGKIWVESSENAGARFYFTLQKPVLDERGRKP